MPRKDATDRHPNKTTALPGVADRCGAKTRAEYNGKPAGRPCGLPAGHGTPSRSGPCRLHGGAAGSVIAKTAEKMDAQKAAARELKKLDLWGARRDELTPVDALAEELSRTAGRVQVLETRLQELGEEDSPRARGLATELTAERGQLQRVAEACERAGVTVKKVEEQLEQGQQLATILRGFLADLDLTAAQQATVQALLSWHMRGRVGDKPPRPSESDLPHYPQQATRAALPAGGSDDRPSHPHPSTTRPTPPEPPRSSERQALIEQLRTTVARATNER